MDHSDKMDSFPHLIPSSDISTTLNNATIAVSVTTRSLDDAASSGGVGMSVTILAAIAASTAALLVGVGLLIYVCHRWAKPNKARVDDLMHMVEEGHGHHPAGVMREQYHHRQRPPVSVVDVALGEQQTVDDSTLGVYTAGRNPQSSSNKKKNKSEVRGNSAGAMNFFSGLDTMDVTKEILASHKAQQQQQQQQQYQRQNPPLPLHHQVRPQINPRIYDKQESSYTTDEDSSTGNSKSQNSASITSTSITLLQREATGLGLHMDYEDQNLMGVRSGSESGSGGGSAGQHYTTAFSIKNGQVVSHHDPKAARPQPNSSFGGVGKHQQTNTNGYWKSGNNGNNDWNPFPSQQSSLPPPQPPPPNYFDTAFPKTNTQGLGESSDQASLDDLFLNVEKQQINNDTNNGVETSPSFPTNFRPTMNTAMKKGERRRDMISKELDKEQRQQACNSTPKTDQTDIADKVNGVKSIASPSNLIKKNDSIYDEKGNSHHEPNLYQEVGASDKEIMKTNISSSIPTNTTTTLSPSSPFTKNKNSLDPSLFTEKTEKNEDTPNENKKKLQSVLPNRTINATPIVTDSDSSMVKSPAKQTKNNAVSLLDEAASNSSSSSDEGDDVGSGARKSSKENWLFGAVEETLGPRAASADMESLGDRSERSRTSSRASRSSHHKNPRYSSTGRTRPKTTNNNSARRRRTSSASASVGSKSSRKSRGATSSVRSGRHSSTGSRGSAKSQHSAASQSVTKDIMRLEAQLAKLGKRPGGSNSGNGDGELSSTRDHRRGGGATARLDHDNALAKATDASGAVAFPSFTDVASEDNSTQNTSKLSRVSHRRIDVVAPPGKLGVILANRSDKRGTVVSEVRYKSPLYQKIFPGDKIVQIDGVPVSRMNVSEITTFMAERASQPRRVLSVVTTVAADPKDDEGSC